MEDLKANTSVTTVKVSPVVQQHYWMCNVTLEFDGFDWWLKLTDVFAVNRWQDDEDSCKVKIPRPFPNMTADQLASFINSIPPCGPRYNGYRNVKPQEVTPLIEAARNNS